MMNDCLVSSIGGESTHWGSIGMWEIRMGSSKHLRMEDMEEKRQYDRLMKKVHAASKPLPVSSQAEGAMARTLCERSEPNKRRDMGSWHPLHVPGPRQREQHTGTLIARKERRCLPGGSKKRHNSN